MLVTATHPEMSAMGWDYFQGLVRQAKMPVFALGGMMKQNQMQAINVGAQGIQVFVCFCPRSIISGKFVYSQSDSLLDVINIKY